MENKLSIPARLSELSVLRAVIMEFIGTALDETDRGRVVLAIDEAVSNVIVHGYKCDESRIIDIEMRSDPDSFTFIISDLAEQFNPLESSIPDIEQYHEEGQSSGLGVDIYRRIMKARYELDTNGGNRLILIKEINNEN